MSTAFLVCGGPSTSNMDLGLLNQRGIAIAAVNMAGARCVRPHYWFCADSPCRFPSHIWRDPAIVKYVRRFDVTGPLTRHGPGGYLYQEDATPADCLNVRTYLTDSDAFDPRTFLTSPEIQWGVAYRSVFLVALRLLHDVGFRTVGLIGCDFSMAGGTYADDVDPDERSIVANETMYPHLDEMLRRLRPVFDDADFLVSNCTIGGNLTAFPRVNFEDAVADAVSRFPIDCNLKDYYRCNPTKLR